MKRFSLVLLSILFVTGAYADFPGSPIGGGGGGSTDASDLSSGTLPAARIADNSVTAVKVVDNTAALIGRFWTGSGDYLKRDGTSGTPAGAGDVVGPGTVTDNTFAIFDGTTGYLLKAGPSYINPTFSTLNVYGANALNLGTGSSIQGTVRFKNATNGNYFQIGGGVSTGNISWTLPTAAPGGANYLLNVDADGTMGYTDPAGWEGMILATRPRLMLWPCGQLVPGT